MSPWLELPLRALACLVAYLLTAFVGAYALIKISSHVHSRLGPMYPGRFHGVGWMVAEGIKWIQKEDVIPARADAPVFRWATLVIVVPVIMTLAVVPIAPGLVAADLDLGVLYVMAVSSVSAVGVVMAAYGAANKFTLIGGLRAVAQIIAYELPLILAAVSVAMLAGTVSLPGIVHAQTLPFVVVPMGAVAFVLFLLASLAEVMWAPFDMPVAESEIIAGPFTEFAGMRYFLILVNETAHAVVLAALSVVLFLGGWRGPLLPPVVWFILKTSAMTFVFIWTRFTLPRFREDQLQRFAWKVLVPVGLANVLAIATWRVLRSG